MADHLCDATCYDEGGIRTCQGTAAYYLSESNHRYGTDDICVYCRHSKTYNLLYNRGVCQRKLTAPLASSEPATNDNTLYTLMSNVCEDNSTLINYRATLKRHMADEKAARVTLEARQQSVHNYEDKITKIMLKIKDTKQQLLDGLLREKDQMTIAITNTEEIGRIE